jgi:alanyl-tRNA synthetase
MLSSNQLRQKYLTYLENLDHAIVPSSLLVPENDPSTLFTTAGMQPMMPYLLGEDHPQGKRIANSQRCFRALDIEEVGDNRHTTFFEMLGNWSLGDYFKKEQLTWFFKFLVEEVGLSAENLYVTVFAGSDKYQIEADEESVKIWQELFANKSVTAQVGKNPSQEGLNNNRIFYYPADKNWWSRSGGPDEMPVGEPGGPDSEVFYDFGEEFKFHENSEFADQPCHVNCDCGRFLEIGNSVFMQYQKAVTGFKDLPQKNIDFGGGLERILAASQHQPDIFQTDLFLPIIRKIEKETNQKYTDNPANFRIIADHIKAAVWLINDGVKPSNKDRGYLVRRLIRRAVRYSQHLTDNSEILPSLVPVVADIYAQTDVSLKQNQSMIETSIGQEVEKFKKTLDKGLKKLEKIFADNKILTGEIAYDLYQTYGFPLELTIEEAESNKVTLGENLQQEFDQAQAKHVELSKTGAIKKFQGGLADNSDITTAYHTTTHLLHAALRQVLGNHIQQKGSHINQDRLRFDFSHNSALTKEEIQQIQDLVNQWIEQDLPVQKKQMAKEEALQSGALAFFADRYPDQVDVYQIGEERLISRELCGGPHVSSTGEINKIEIFKEKSAAAGVRRIYVKVKS